MKIIKYRVHRDDRVVIDGRELRLRETTQAGHVFDVVGEDGAQIAFTWAEFAREVGRDGFQRDQLAYAESEAAVTLQTGVPRLSGVPAHEIPALLLRRRWVLGFLALEEAGEASRSDASMAVAIERIRDEIAAEREASRQARPRKPQFNSKPSPSGDDADGRLRAPCVKTLRAWVTRYEEGGKKAIALRYYHHRSGNRERSLSPEIQGIVRDAARGYMSMQRPSRALCFKALKIAVRETNASREANGLDPLHVPSKRVLDAEIAALPKSQVYAARKGADKAQAKYGPLGAGPDIDRAGQRIEFDEWEVHALSLLDDHRILETLDATWRASAERHRLWVCEAIDAASDLTVGLSFAPTGGTTAAAMACLAMVLSDKTELAKWAGATSRWDMCCSPEEVITDGGTGYVSAPFVSAVLDLLGDKSTTPAGVAPLRGRIERRFLTKELRLMPLVPGRTYLNPIDRGDYDSYARAAILDTLLRKLIIIDAVDVCANSPNHGRLRGATPLDTWDELVATKGVYPPPDAEDRRNALGATLSRETGRHGVRVMNLHYTNDELQRRFRHEGARTATVRVDPADLGAVSIWTSDGWLACDCVQPAMRGTSLDVWVAAEADLRRRYAARAALAEPVVLDAIKRMKLLVGGAEHQFGLGGACPTGEEFDRLESQMLISFPPRVADPDFVPRDLLAAAVPRGTPIEPYAVMGGDEAAQAEGGPRPVHEILEDVDDSDDPPDDASTPEAGRDVGEDSHGDDERVDAPPDGSASVDPAPAENDDFPFKLEDDDDDVDDEHL